MCALCRYISYFSNFFPHSVAFLVVVIFFQFILVKFKSECLCIRPVDVSFSLR